MIAVVAMKDGESAAEEIISFAKDRVAAYKYARSVTFVDELLKTASGKILERELTKGTADIAESARVKS